jgi:segregation and condensation protein B
MSSASPMADSPEPGTAAEPAPAVESTEVVEAPSPPPPSPAEVQASVEALLYASALPLSLRDLRKALPEAGEQVRAALERLQELYGQEGRGLQLTEVAGGFQITTRPEQHEVVSRLFDAARPTRLTLQALETLAVIAYRQPVTIPEIMDLRGVRSASVVRTLLERKLVRIVGRKSVVGRPLMYGTTREFLLRFGLKDLRDLPQLKDMAEVFGDEAAQAFEVLDALPSPPVRETSGADGGAGDEDARAD